MDETKYPLQYILEALESTEKIPAKVYTKPLALIDTSSVIDLEEMLRKNNQRDKSTVNFEDYMHEIGEKLHVLVSPCVLTELITHANVKINSRRREISVEALGTAMLFHSRFQELYGNLNFEGYGESGLWNYLSVSHVSREVHEEDGDEPSHTDREILMKAVHFARIPNHQGEFPGKVFVISSDNHVLAGAEKLRKLNYPLTALSTKKLNKLKHPLEFES